MRGGDPVHGGKTELTSKQRERIGAAFSAAHDYDAHARVQARSAQALAQRVAALDFPATPHLLEIGCGTGFLTAALIDAGLAADAMITDLSPAMLARARARVGDAPGRVFAVLDGEYGQRPHGAPFDLIVSNLTFQWFEDLPAAVTRLVGWLAPGGQLLFTTLAHGTFAEWRAAHAAEGQVPGTPPFPSLAALGTIAPMHKAAEPQLHIEVERHASARDFLASLKAIGAGTASPSHRPLPPSALRRVKAAFERSGAAVTYEIVTCHYRAGPA